MTNRKWEERPEREVSNQFQLCDSGNVQRNHYAPECVVEMYDAMSG